MKIVDIRTIPLSYRSDPAWQRRRRAARIVAVPIVARYS
jgi:hypothetical protein